MKQGIGLLILVSLLQPVYGFELFGVNVNNANREQLRQAIRVAGITVTREAGDDNWFDIYDARAVFKQSRNLFVAYDKRTGKFAFAEYALPYGYLRVMQQRLTIKYGQPQTRYGAYPSDTSFHWISDGIQISLTPVWRSNKLQLLYSNPVTMPSLLADYQQFRGNEISRVLQTDASYF